MPQKSIGIAIQQELEPLHLWSSLKIRNLQVPAPEDELLDYKMAGESEL